MNEIRVECYSGFRADERPLRFVIRGREFRVLDLDGRWYSPEASYFRVVASDGNFYVLRHDETQDSWTLDGFRAARAKAMSQTQAPFFTGIEMRRHRRYRVPDGVEIRVAGDANGRRVEGIATVLGLGGMFVRTKVLLPPGSALALAMSSPIVAFEAQSAVRHVSSDGMGIEYASLTPDNQKKLRAFLWELQSGAVGVAPSNS